MTTKKTPRPVIVSTANRGIFFGYTSALGPENGQIELTKCRMVVYYTADTRGFNGLATRGVFKGARITPPADRGVFCNVTAVLDCSPEAAETYSKEFWG